MTVAKCPKILNKLYVLQKTSKAKRDPEVVAHAYNTSIWRLREDHDFEASVDCIANKMPLIHMWPPNSGKISHLLEPL